jgi:hypothetical protein
MAGVVGLLYEDELRKTRVENARLRAALKEIAGFDYSDAGKIARAALGDEQDTGQ